MVYHIFKIEEFEQNGTEVAVALVHKTLLSCTTRGTQLGDDFLDERRDLLAAFFQKSIGIIINRFDLLNVIIILLK